MDLLLNISVPAIAEDYDAFVPDFLEIGSILPLIAKAVEEMSDQRFRVSGRELLCFNGRIIPNDVAPKQLNIANGDQLILF